MSFETQARALAVEWETVAAGLESALLPKPYEAAAYRIAASGLTALLDGEPAEPEAEAHPQFSAFVATACQDPEVKAAFDAANERAALGDLVTETGFVLGDVIAKAVVAAGYLPEPQVRARERAAWDAGYETGREDEENGVNKLDANPFGGDA